MLEFEKEEELRREKAMALKDTLKFLCKSDCKKWVKQQLKQLTILPIWLQREDSATDVFLRTKKYAILLLAISLVVGIIRTDALWIRHLHLEYKELWQKKRSKI